MSAAPSVLVIDNYDSFTYNLVQYLGELGAAVEVVRNDRISVDEIAERAPERLVISPGPCTPDEAGISIELVRRLGAQLPILGVCLGHQAIARAYGASVVHARQVMHGKTSRIHHHGEGVFKDLGVALVATRYHSLIVDPGSLPPELIITAWTEHEDGSSDEIMGLRHAVHPVQGVQFHPESILTHAGRALLRNFLSG